MSKTNLEPLVLEWHFFPNEDGIVRISPSVLDALDDAGINYVIYLP